MKRRVCAALPSLAVLLVLTSCTKPDAGSPPPDTTTPGGSVQQQSSLFVQSASNTNEHDFSTNDPAYWGINGFTLWALPSSFPVQAPFSTRDVTVVKGSGDGYAGYGIVFCSYDTGSSPAVETFLLVMINTQQQYSVGEVTGSSYTPYTTSTWVSSSYLAKGYGVTNHVVITRNGTGLFALSLNSQQVMTFRDGRTPTQTGGADGYLVVISPQDSFPQTPVSVTFTEN